MVRTSLLALALSAAALRGQETPAAEGAVDKAPEAGFPVSNALVVSKCGTCHKADAKGNLTRISWIRTTPEGWEEAIKRMIRLNGLTLQPDEARAILRYLSDHHGLAPDEAKPVAYMAERRLIDEKIPNEEVAHACKACHALGKPLSWRRSLDDWKLLRNMHFAYFPNVESTAFLRPPRRPDAPPPPPGTDTREPVDQAFAYFVKNGPLHAPEWAEWHAGMRTPKLSGRWLVAGTQPGKGRFFGEMIVESNGDLFSTKTKIQYARDGSELTSSGSGLVYTGYAWRGRAKMVGTTSDAPDAPTAFRQVMMVSRDQSQMEGRWFWGAYDEFGMDVMLRRAGDGGTVLGVDVSALKTGSSDNRVRVFGDRLPRDASAADFDFGAGVKVTKIAASRPDMITVHVDVAAGAIPGKRDVAFRNSSAPGVLAVYDKIDYVKIPAETAMAHLGGKSHEKGYFQFEAVAYNNGPDGKPNTPDDIALGPVPAQWKMEEYVATFGDDDTEFVGALNGDTGFFNPATDGPNPKRRHSRNNYGDVWVVASYRPPGVDKPLIARSYLIVTVPQYVRWDQPEVAE